MHANLTPTAAKDLGRSIRFIRTARELTLRDIALVAELSPQYVQQIERGIRLNVSQEAYTRLAKPLGIPEAVIDDLVMRARVQSALEQRGLNQDQVAFVWRGVEARLVEQGVAVQTDVSKVVAEIMGVSL